jgi:hypothetical protein
MTDLRVTSTNNTDAVIRQRFYFCWQPLCSVVVESVGDNRTIGSERLEV